MDGAAWTSEAFRAAVARAAGAASRPLELLELLREEHPAYDQCGAAELVSRRGWVMVELGKASLGPEAMPLVLEELQTGQNPYLLAAAARALRQAPSAMPACAPPLLRAIQTLARRDDAIDLSVWGGLSDSDSSGTALSEALMTLRWLSQAAQGIRAELLDMVQGQAPLAEEHQQALNQILADLIRATPKGTGDSAECCRLPLPWRRLMPFGRTEASIEAVRFEDQDGQTLTWRQAFVGQPTILAFFYTRCDNEQKCSLTVSKLAVVQRLLQSSGPDPRVRLAAITYDPDFDHPQRLQRYAHSRSLVTGDGCRVLRAMEGREALQQYFASGVNFVGSLVNRHRVEVFVLDAQGGVRITYQRLSWEPEEVLADAQALQSPRVQALPMQKASSRQTLGRRLAALKLAPAGWALLLALLPKCPICGAAYLSASGLAALPYLPGWVQAWPVVALLLLINLAALAWVAKARNSWAPLSWSLAGVVLLIWQGLAMGNDFAMALGAISTAIGSALAVREASPWRKGYRQGAVGN